jgi:hypothetical protein
VTPGGSVARRSMRAAAAVQGLGVKLPYAIELGLTDYCVHRRLRSGRIPNGNSRGRTKCHFRIGATTSAQMTTLRVDAPMSRAAETAGRIVCRPIFSGLHHQYAWTAKAWSGGDFEFAGVALARDRGACGSLRCDRSPPKKR